MQNTGRGNMHNAKCTMQNAQCKMHNTTVLYSTGQCGTKALDTQGAKRVLCALLEG